MNNWVPKTTRQNVELWKHEEGNYELIVANTLEGLLKMLTYNVSLKVDFAQQAQ